MGDAVLRVQKHLQELSRAHFQSVEDTHQSQLSWLRKGLESICQEIDLAIKLDLKRPAPASYSEYVFGAARAKKQKVREFTHTNRADKVKEESITGATTTDSAENSSEPTAATSDPLMSEPLVVEQNASSNHKHTVMVKRTRKVMKPKVKQPTSKLALMDVSELKVVDLRAELKKRGLKANGVKATLINRLLDAMEADNSGDDEVVEMEEVEEEYEEEIEMEANTVPNATLKTTGEESDKLVSESRRTGEQNNETAAAEKETIVPNPVVKSKSVVITTIDEEKVSEANRSKAAASTHSISPHTKIMPGMNTDEVVRESVDIDDLSPSRKPIGSAQKLFTPAEERIQELDTNSDLVSSSQSEKTQQSGRTDDCVQTSGSMVVTENTDLPSTHSDAFYEQETIILIDDEDMTESTQPDNDSIPNRRKAQDNNYPDLPAAAVIIESNVSEDTTKQKSTNDNAQETTNSREVQDMSRMTATNTSGKVGFVMNSTVMKLREALKAQQREKTEESKSMQTLDHPPSKGAEKPSKSPRQVSFAKSDAHDVIIADSQPDQSFQNVSISKAISHSPNGMSPHRSREPDEKSLDTMLPSEEPQNMNQEVVVLTEEERKQREYQESVEREAQRLRMAAKQAAKKRFEEAKASSAFWAKREQIKQQLQSSAQSVNKSISRVTPKSAEIPTRKEESLVYSVVNHARAAHSIGTVQASSGYNTLNDSSAETLTSSMKSSKAPSPAKPASKGDLEPSNSMTSSSKSESVLLFTSSSADIKTDSTIVAASKNVSSKAVLSSGATARSDSKMLVSASNSRVEPKKGVISSSVSRTEAKLAGSFSPAPHVEPKLTVSSSVASQSESTSAISSSSASHEQPKRTKPSFEVRVDPKPTATASSQSRLNPKLSSTSSVTPRDDQAMLASTSVPREPAKPEPSSSSNVRVDSKPAGSSFLSSRIDSKGQPLLPARTSRRASRSGSFSQSTSKSGVPAPSYARGNKQGSRSDSLSSTVSSVSETSAMEVAQKLAAATASTGTRKPTNLVSGIHSFAALIEKENTANQASTSSTRSAPVVNALKMAEKSRLLEQKKRQEKMKRKEALMKKYEDQRKLDDEKKKKMTQLKEKTEREAKLKREQEKLQEKKQREMEQAKKRAQKLQEMRAGLEKKRAAMAAEKAGAKGVIATSTIIPPASVQQAAKSSTLVNATQTSKQPSVPRQDRQQSAVDTSGEVVNYEISDNAESSGSEVTNDSDEENRHPTKNIPKWAQRDNLEKALRLQFGPNGIDPTPSIFPEFIDTCDLEEIFQPTDIRKKRRFARRTSSGNWFGDRPTAKEKAMYKRDMGYNR